jgi:hypothetical protein
VGVSEDPGPEKPQFLGIPNKELSRDTDCKAAAKFNQECERVSETRKVYSPRKCVEGGPVRGLKRSTCGSIAQVAWFGWVCIHYKG